MPAPTSAPTAPPADDVSALLDQEIAGLREELDGLLADKIEGGLSEAEAQDLLAWAQGLQGKVKAVAALLADPSPAGVSAYLRFISAHVAATRSRRFATSSLRILRAVLSR